ncbi:hypothetical protein C5167_009509 [Papaver somniferum]|uniref:Kinesin motor domain-containing protein n=1 Tax=Papaver somniferum TaxID=3469 RepID=A0A4Y7K0I3_PAPSO|nr:hypothetical protein C5167_009509 [Papaver somniferum]
MAPLLEISENKLPGGILTQSIRKLLPRSSSANMSLKMKSIKSIDTENTPPLDPNVQLDNDYISSPVTKKSPLKSVSFQRDVLVLDQQVDKSATLPPDPSVKIIARIRPVSWRERDLPTVRKVSPTSISVEDRVFNFDSVVDSTSTQEDIFQLVGVPVVKDSLAGYNTTVLSYGQTGSGKTYTMWGPPSAMVEGHSPSSNQGIVPRIFQMLFSDIQREQENSGEKQVNYQCRCSFLEIYNEQIGDLLDPTQRNLKIRDDAKNGFYVENLTEESVTSYDDVTQILIKGLSNRKVGATSINSKSSRSHVVFTCVVESWCKVTSSKCISSSKTSRISLVDLAGSDRNKLEDASIKEARNVRKSLAQLGRLVNTLAENPQPGNPSDVPYRSSCLTHLLRESFGGNAKLSVLCTVSPHDRCKGETLSTLRFGQRAKSIQNEPQIMRFRRMMLMVSVIRFSKVSGYNSMGKNSEYYGGKSARESLNQLRLSLNRSDPTPCKRSKSQLENYNKPILEKEENTDLPSDESKIDDTDFEELIGTHRTFKGGGSSVAPQDNLTNLTRASLSGIPLRQVSVLQEPTFSESPKFENTQKRRGLRQSVKRSDQIRASLRASTIFSGATESLAASLHRGLQIIDQHQRSSASSKSSVALSFDHLALKPPCQENEKSIAGLQTLPEDGSSGSFICAACKQPGVDESEQVEDSFNKWIVPGGGAVTVDQASKDTQIALAEALKREGELKTVCAEQVAKIEQLDLLVKKYEEQGQNSVTSQDYSENLLEMADHESKKMSFDTSEREEHLKEIEGLKNRLQSYNDVPSDLSQSILSIRSNDESHFQEKIDEVIEKERQKWTKMESEWICLTDELRISIELQRQHSEKVEAELTLEKKVTEELDETLDRAVLGHARMVEHYVELQEKHIELLGRNRRIMEGIAEVKKAAAKAGGKGKSSSRFLKSLATELSALRVEREKEREHLRKENNRLKIQLRDTAEAVHAAGELLVRLREAEEAVSVAEGNYMNAKKDNEKIRKQLEKQKRKHAMEMVTMKQYLAESRLPESALQPMYWKEEEDRATNSISNSNAAVTEDDQSWRTAFQPAYQERY